MNKKEKVLIENIKEMKGKILGFGNLSDKIIDSINKNNNIEEFVLLSDNYGLSSGKSRKSKTKKITYRKIRKQFKNKNITNIIASYEKLKKYKRRFISDSLFLSKDKIYIFIKNNEKDIEIIKKRYERYKQEIKMINCKDGTILIIIKKHYKKNKLKDTIYLIIDIIIDELEIIGDLFIS